MNTIVIWILIFLEIFSYIIFLDVLLSWLTLIWIRFRPKFIGDILDPFYNFIKKIIPTNIWPIEFSAFILILFIILIRWAIFIVFPEVRVEINSLIR